jgi:uncharacterized repeat protein (TIGR01451 family)
MHDRRRKMGAGAWQRDVVSLLILGLLLVGASGVATADEQVIGRPTVEVFAPDNELQPGEETTVQVYVSNEGELRRSGISSFVERVTTARGTTLEVEAGSSPIQVDTERYPVGSVPIGTAGPFPIEVTVPENATPGTYSLPVRVRYRYTSLISYDLGPGGPANVEYQIADYSRRQGLAVRVADIAQFEITGVESSAQIDDTGEMAVTVRNTGTAPARNAQLTLRSPSDELTFGSESREADNYIGRLGPGQTTTVTGTVALTEDAKTRPYTLSGTVNYDDTDGVRQESETLTGSLTPRDEQTFAIEDVRSSLRVGAEGEFSGTVVNRGPGPVEQPVIVLVSTGETITATEGEYALSSLQSGERAAFTFDADVADTADPGPRQFDLRVRYRNEDGDQRESDTIDARVNITDRRDEFDVSLADADLALEPGGTTALVLSIRNDADERLENIELKAYPNDPLSSSDDTAFVDSLGANETTELTVALGAAGDATAKTYPLSMDLQYVDASGETELSESYTVGVPVTSPPDTGDNRGLVPLIGIALVVLLAVGYLWRRR